MAGYRINMQQLASMRQPVMVQLKEELYNLKKDDILAEEKAGGYGSQSQAHFVIVTSISEELVQIKDPALGNREMSIKEFSDFWLDAKSDIAPSVVDSAKKGVVLAVVGKTQ
jgi:predicted double-glycine peptidase